MDVPRYLRIYSALLKNSVVREMGFKANFILWIFVELLWFALQVSFISVIYRHTDRIGDWTKWEVVLLVGASQFIQHIFGSIFLSNMIQLSEYVRTGKLDFMLLLPVNTRFLVSFRVIDLGGIFNAGAGLALVIYSLAQLHKTPSLPEILGFGLLTVAGVTIHYSLMLMLAATSFYTVRAQGIVWGYYNLFNLARLPDVAFHGLFKIVFTFVLPILLVANVPAKLLMHRLSSPGEMLILLLMTAICFAVSELVWRFSLGRYTSASS